MPEVIVKYKSVKALEALKAFAKFFDVIVEQPKSTRKNKTVEHRNIPISFAQNPDVTALAGIWKDKEITIEELRKKAWGNRI